MSHNNREIEIKLVIDPASLSLYKGRAKMVKATQRLQELMARLNLTMTQVVHGKSSDFYYDSPKGAKADFARARALEDNQGALLSVKASDKRNNFDRIETKDIFVEDMGTAKLFLELLLGKSVGEVEKTYMVYFLDDKETNISVYQITGSKYVFIEIEAQKHELVVDLCELLLSQYPLPVSRVENSLYSIFVKGEALKIKKLRPGKVAKDLMVKKSKKD